MILSSGKTLRVCFVCCRSDGTGEIDLLKKLMANSGKQKCECVQNPADADLILIAGILEGNAFENLRSVGIWKQYPEKSFGYSEADNVPFFLHGIYSSATRTKGIFNRMQSCGYPAHNAWLQNFCPLPLPFYQQPKQYLFSFIGRNSHPIRKKLFRMTWPGKDVLVADSTREYEHFKDQDLNRREMQIRYWEAMAQSKFVLCPRGAGASSIRLFEVMWAGVAPVIISDGWIPPLGPGWKEFAICIPHRSLDRTYEILKFHESEYQDRGRLAAAAYAKWFSYENAWDQMLAMIQTIRSSQRLPEKFFVRAEPVIYCLEKLHEWRFQFPIMLVSAFRSARKQLNLLRN